MKLKSLFTGMALTLAALSAQASDFSAYYSFEGQANGYKDISSNGNDGYFLNSGKGRYVLNGRNGLAMQNDVFVVGSLPAHKKDVPLTLSLWINTSSFSSEHTLISKLDTATNQGFELKGSSTGLNFTLNDNSGNGLEVKSDAINESGWVHLAVTYSGNGKASGVLFYVNGLEKTASVVADTLATDTNTFGPLYIGASIKNSQPFNGSIDEVLITPRAYSLGQIGCLATFGSDCATASGLGPRGDAGPQGPQGDSGEQGPAGPDGLPGAQGPQGLIGLAGPVGPAGNRGTTGLIGAQGAKGANGINGKNGVDGSDGVTGAKGPRGRIGPAGSIGDVGPSGARGAKGTKGPTGEKGNTGVRGDKGADGPTGSQGPRGVTGAPGRDGADGAIGPRGMDGEQGPSGYKGPRGDKGNTGSKGLSAAAHFGSGLAAEKQRQIGNAGAVGPQGARGYPGQCICVDKFGRRCQAL